MKKKRILLGLALTAAATLSLASCGSSKEKSSKAAESSQVASSAAGQSTPGQSTPGQSTPGQSTPASSSSNAQSSEITVTFYKDEAGTQVLQTFTVSEGDVVAAIDYTETAPSGKKFSTWAYKGGTNYNPADGIWDTTELVPVFVDLSKYDELVASANLVYNADFEDLTIGTNFSLLPSSIATATGPYVEESSDTIGGKVATVNNSNAVQTIDTDTSKQAKLVVLFGQDIKSATVKGYLELTTSGAGSKWPFLQFVGLTGEGSLATRFVIGEDANKHLGYSVDGSTWVGAFRSNEYASNETLKISFEFNLATGTVSATNTKADGTVETICENYNAGITDLVGVRLVTGGSKTDRVLSLDNIAITAEAMSVAEYQTAKKAELAAAKDAYNSTDYSETNFATIGTIYNTTVAAIDAATTTDAIDTLLAAAIKDMSEVKTLVQEAQEAGVAEITAYATTKKENVDTDVVAEVDAIVTTYTASINAATTVAAVDQLVSDAKEQIDMKVTVQVELTFTAVLADGTAVSATIDSIKVGSGYTAKDAGIEDVTVTVGTNSYKVLAYYTKYTNADATDNEVLDIANTPITADTAVILVVELIQHKELNYTAKAVEEGDTWTLSSSGAQFKDAATNNTDSSNNLDAIQITLKTSESKDGYIQTPTIADETTSVTVNMTGWTKGGSGRLDYVIITAYDASGNAVGTVKAYTSANKTNGAFSSDAAGEVTDIVVTGTSNISYLRFSCGTDTKSYFVSTIKVSYNK